jgi:hypothetical protein
VPKIHEIDLNARGRIKGDDALRWSRFEEASHDARRYDWDTRRFCSRAI